MHAVTLEGEYKIWNIVTKKKVGELPNYISSQKEYHWIVLNK